MSKIQAISDGSSGYIYPVTIPAAIIDPATGSSVQLGSGGGGSAVYAGPFAVSTNGTQIVVAGGRMYLGGTEITVPQSTITSGNGNVYYYLYYSGGSYFSGCSVAASAGALNATIRGSQGYYTALANVSGGVTKQYHYGDIVIDGRVS